MIQTDVRKELLRLSREIHDDPELGYEEHRAVDRICDLLQQHGVAPERGIGGIATAFRARIGGPGPAVALLAEYDALPEVGHGCGHNLIAMTNVGAFLEIASEQPRLDVAIELIGTPAEENGGGKIALLEAGVFRDVIAVLSSHPSASARWAYGEKSLGVIAKKVTYRGRSAHAAYSPELGRNALNGLIRLFVGVDGWRQHLPANTRVHGVITYGGGAPNVVPERAEAVFGLRAADMRTLEGLESTFEDIARGAALQTGTGVEVVDESPRHLPLAPNARLRELLGEELTRRGIDAHGGGTFMASTDLGNVSQVVPTDHVGFPVTSEPIAGHSHAMTAASISGLAHENAFAVIDVLAAAARRVASDRALRESLAS
ncbi:MAG TPA: amidohydrolase [Candidatus Dormibacteraeota bacterium]|nr:amidohydrolase [Candidatus Dormibacteraeota bacterium]